MSFDPALLSLCTYERIYYQDLYDTDYVLQGMNKRDVADLASPDGDPAAIPISDGIRDTDYKYNYVSGARGENMRLKLYNPSFNIDFIGTDVRTKLKRWRHNNRRVMLAQNIGEATRLSYAPVHQDGQYFRESGFNFRDKVDLAQWNTYQNSKSLLWDHTAKIFRGPMPANNNCVVPTPGGAGLLSLSNHRNRQIPSYPEGSGQGPGSGVSGWTKGGSDYTDITFSLINNGFGHNDCPHSLKVETSDLVSSSRYIYMASAWDSGHGSYQGYSFTGSGFASFTVWLKGRFPNGSYLKFLETADPSNYQIQTLDDKNLGDWTPVSVTLYDSNWSATKPQIYLYLQGTKKDPAAFEIGPMMFNQTSGQYQGNQPFWRDWSDGAAGGSYVEATSFKHPMAGCMTVSFYCPPGMNNTQQRIGFLNDPSSSGFSFNMYANIGEDEWTLRLSSYASPTVTYSADFTRHFDDEIVVVSFQYGQGRKAIYMNGDKLGEWDDADDQDWIENTGALKVGYGGTSYDILPCALLAARIDEGTFTDQQVKYMHSAMRDPGALAVSVPARGRVFKVVEVPSTPRPSPAGTQWIGRLKLEQVDYDPDNADITAKETLKW